MTKLKKIFSKRSRTISVVIGCFLGLVLAWTSLFGLWKTVHHNLLENKTYLIALMNTDEKKPDGGFFGSYIIAKGTGNTVSFDFFDSYYPQTIKDIKVKLPNRFKPVMGVDEIGFLGVNMLGFTDLDGKNITKIYEQTFKEKLDGVIFIKSSLFTYLDQDLQEFFRKQEFQNASIDLIRKEKKGNPKELYFQDTKELLHSRQMKKLIIKGFFHLQEIFNRGFIRIYLNSEALRTKQTYSNLQDIIQKNNLTNSLSGNSILSYDYNLGFNKIDGFATKTISISSGNKILYRGHDKIRKIPKKDFFQKGIEYKLQIDYEISIPQLYFDYITSLEKEYGIKLSEREKTILSVDPQFYTRGVVYLPFDTNILNIQGELLSSQNFNTPFGKGIVYDIVGKGKNIKKSLFIDFKLK